jgi:hypothetical protein
MFHSGRMSIVNKWGEFGTTHHLSIYPPAHSL